MPLTQELAKKLSKRGLLNLEDTKTSSKEYANCPNKSNIFHNCNKWCTQYWRGYPVVDRKYSARVKKMLEKYPLPLNWTKEYDPGLGRYYYWNLQSNLVSWLPPAHPKCYVTEPANVLRQKLQLNKKI